MKDMATEGAKQVVDAVSIFTVVGTLGDMLPPMAALFTIIWTGIRIYETQTIQKIIGRKPPDDL